MAKETSRTAKLCTLMERQGAMIYPLMAGRGRPLGWPDRLIVWHGVTWYVEFKDGRNSLGGAQRQVISDLRKQGVPAFVGRFDSDEDGDDLIIIEDHLEKVLNICVGHNKFLRSLENTWKNICQSDSC